MKYVKKNKRYRFAMRVWQLISTIIGIYVSYYFYYLQLLDIKNEKYRITNPIEQQKQQQNFPFTNHIIIFPAIFTSFVGNLLLKLKNQKNSQNNSQKLWDKQAENCGLAIFFINLCYALALLVKTATIGFLVQVAKDCQVLFVILVGVFFSKVTDQKLRLTKDKIIIGVLITIGLIVNSYINNLTYSVKIQEKDIIGIFLLIVAIVSEAVLPDLQQAIKAKHRPSAIEMMTSINGWIGIIGAAYYIVSIQFIELFRFIYYHENIKLDLFYISLPYVIGQIFVYRMITQFKQHFYPIVFALKEIFVFVFFSKSLDEVNTLQTAVIFFLIGVAGFEFFQQLKHEKNEKLPQKKQRNNKMAQLKQSPRFEKISNEKISKLSNKREDSKEYDTIESETLLNNENEKERSSIYL